MEAFRIGIETLSYIHPAVWIIELGELAENSAIEEIIQSIQDALDNYGRAYNVQAVRHLGPAFQGYPTRQTRTYIVGWGAPRPKSGCL